jgi:hypothetical protein
MYARAMILIRPLTGLVLALFLIAAADPAFAAKKKSKTPVAPLDPVMTFAIVRRADVDCEKACPHWIAAEGRIDENTPQRFRKFLKLVGDEKLPVVLTSSGGSLNGAMALGRLIRAKKLMVAVGRTIYSGCQPRDKTCVPLASSDPHGMGYIDLTTAYCYSACPFVLASGVVRMVDKPSRVGVHQITTYSSRVWITYRETYRMVKGKKKVISRKEVGRKVITNKPTKKITKGQRKVYLAYLKEMGITAGLLDEFDRAGPQDIYVMSDNELIVKDLKTSPLSPVSLAVSKLCLTLPLAPHCVSHR